MEGSLRILFLIALLTGCSSQPRVMYVDIPVEVSPKKITLPHKPILPIRKLNDKSTPDEVVKAYASSLEKTNGYCEQLNTILQEYQK